MAEPAQTNKMTTKAKLEKIQFNFLVADIERENQTLAEEVAKLDYLIKK